jgi:hypothetical protein
LQDENPYAGSHNDDQSSDPSGESIKLQNLRPRT